VICHHFKWKRVSLAAGLCYGSRGGGAQLAFHHQLGAYDTDTLIGALEGLRRFLGGQKATLLWDGLPAHRSHAMRAWLRRQRSWLVVEPLPAYAPELNPSSRCGPASRGWSWPTWPARASRRSLRRPSVASTASATPTSWPSRFCVTAVCPYGEQRSCHWRERPSLYCAQLVVVAFRFGPGTQAKLTLTGYAPRGKRCTSIVQHNSRLRADDGRTPRPQHWGWSTFPHRTEVTDRIVCPARADGRRRR
jgi:DDE superfamily endonuclease